MAAQVTQLTRVFRHNDTDYPDPSPGSPPGRALEVLALANPAFNNAVLDAPEIEGDKQVFDIRVSVGTKG